MQMKLMPSSWAYWVAGTELQLGPADMAPAGAPMWPYAAVIVSDDAMLAFLAKAEAAGVAGETVAQIKRERQLLA